MNKQKNLKNLKEHKLHIENNCIHFVLPFIFFALFNFLDFFNFLN